MKDKRLWALQVRRPRGFAIPFPKALALAVLNSSATVSLVWAFTRITTWLTKAVAGAICRAEAWLLQCRPKRTYCILAFYFILISSKIGFTPITVFKTRSRHRRQLPWLSSGVGTPTPAMHRSHGTGSARGWLAGTSGTGDVPCTLVPPGPPVGWTCPRWSEEEDASPALQRCSGQDEVGGARAWSHLNAFGKGHPWREGMLELSTLNQPGSQTITAFF